MLGARVLSGVLIVAALVLTLYLDQWLAPWFPFWFCVAGAVMAAVALELAGLLEETVSRPSIQSVLGGLAAILLANWAPRVVELRPASDRISAIVFEPSGAVSALAWPLLSFVAVFMLTFLVESLRFNEPGRAVASIAGTILVIAYTGLLGTFIIQMRWLDGCKHGLVPLAFLIATTKGADTGAYTVGRLVGRHKLWPAVSPNKTIEGAIGGLAFALIAALVVEGVAQSSVSLAGVGWPAAVFIGLTLGVVGQLGDLMESMIKRDCRRKDASTAVPGFGGVLDVLDSILFAAPVAYGLWLFFGP